MVMNRSLMTATLASVLLGGLGLAAFSQVSEAQTSQAPTPSAQPAQGQRPSAPTGQAQSGQGQGPQQAEGNHRGRGQGLAEAAAQLGVSEADLKAALGLPAEPPPRPDLAAAATQLGVSETNLREALRSNMRNARQEGEGGRGQAIAATAAQLGVSEADLKTALGLPAEPPPRPDLAAAATQLGVSETELREALRSARGGRGCGPEAAVPAEPQA